MRESSPAVENPPHAASQPTVERKPTRTADEQGHQGHDNHRRRNDTDKQTREYQHSADNESAPDN